MQSLLAPLFSAVTMQASLVSALVQWRVGLEFLDFNGSRHLNSSALHSDLTSGSDSCSVDLDVAGRLGLGCGWPSERGLGCGWLSWLCTLEAVGGINFLISLIKTPTGQLSSGGLNQ